MPFDVVIPAHNNAATISRVLIRLRPQCADGDRGVIVDDGSTDATADVIERTVASWRDRVALVRQPQRGPAAARNAAVKLGTNHLLLFLGADIVPDATLLSRHRAVHTWYPESTVGCLGFVTWDSSLPPTPFMVWLEHGGNQNAYGEIAGKTWVDPRAYCYCANLSVKREFLEDAGGFDEEHFRSYGWEDLDLGIRLARRGCRLCYEPTARARHVHAHTVSSIVQRQRQLGTGAVILERLHPDSVRFPPKQRGWLLRICRRLLYALGTSGWFVWLVGFFGRRFILPRMYEFLLSSSFKKSVQGSREPHRSVEKDYKGILRLF